MAVDTPLEEDPTLRAADCRYRYIRACDGFGLYLLQQIGFNLSGYMVMHFVDYFESVRNV